MSALVHCKGLQCHNAYAQIHPNATVHSFQQAMDPMYDTLYAELPKFFFRTCISSYSPFNEPTWTQTMSFAVSR
jgi:hypothetical protein